MVSPYLLRRKRTLTQFRIDRLLARLKLRRQKPATYHKCLALHLAAAEPRSALDD